MTRYLIVLFLAFATLFSVAESQWKAATMPAMPDGGYYGSNYVNGILDYHSTVYAATSAGLCLSTDRGRVWIFSPTFPYREYVGKITSENNTLYVKSESGTYKSTDDGVSWTMVTEPNELISGRDSIFRQERFFMGSTYKYSLVDSVPWNPAYYYDHRDDSLGYRFGLTAKIYNDTIRGTLFPSPAGMIYPQKIMDNLNESFWQRDQTMRMPIYSFFLNESLYIAGSQGNVYTLKQASSEGWDSLPNAGLYPEFAVNSLIKESGTFLAATQRPNPSVGSSMFRLRQDASLWERLYFRAIGSSDADWPPVYSTAVVDSFLFVGISRSTNGLIYYCPLSQITGYNPAIQWVYAVYYVNEPKDTLDVIGINFYENSQIEFDGTLLPTKFETAGLLRFPPPSTMFLDGGLHVIRVFTPREGGFYSNPETLRVGYRRPELNSISPTWAHRDSSPVIRVMGKHFYDVSRVVWFENSIFNWEVLPTTFISDSVLEARPTPLQMSIARDRTIRVRSASGGVNSAEYKIFTIRVDTSGTDVRESGSGIPETFSLSENYPNPFNPTTSVKIGVPTTSALRAVIYDLAGREVEVIANKSVSPGWYSIDWNADRYASGIYVLRVTARGFTATRRLLLLR